MIKFLRENMFSICFWSFIVVFLGLVMVGCLKHEDIKSLCYQKGGIPIESRNMQITCVSKEYIVK